MIPNPTTQECDDQLLVDLFRTPEFDAEGRQGDHDNLRPCQTAVRVLRELKEEVERLKALLIRSNDYESRTAQLQIDIKAALSRDAIGTDNKPNGHKPECVCAGCERWMQK